MASNSVGIYIPVTDGYDGYNLTLSGGSVTGSWCDKRSAKSVSISCTLTGTGTPDGYWHIETSNAPENKYVTWGSGPLVLPGSTKPVDVTTYPASTSSHITAIGTYWTDVNTPARWVRAVYVSNGNPGNLIAYVYMNVPFDSP